MACSLPLLEELTRRSYPKPHMPPKMNREQAWAWALDNFEALSCPSSLHPQYRGSANPSIVTVLDGATFGAERGQKRCREPHVKEPKAETVERLWDPEEVEAASWRGAHWALNQPEDGSAPSGGEMGFQIESRSPDRALKRLKTEAYTREEPGRKRHPSRGYCTLGYP
ncbi:hypothetical protein HispidOSU_029521 [Sigmodon hispidus]